jgi:ABC-type amino acid transport substrate-binding protein
MAAPTHHTYDTEGSRGTPIPLYEKTFIPLHHLVCGHYSQKAQRSGIVEVNQIKEDIAPGGVMRVAVSSADKLVEGVSPHLAKEIGKELGVKVEFKKYPTAAAIAEKVDAGEWDVCFMGADPAHGEAIFFTEPYATDSSEQAVQPAMGCKRGKPPGDGAIFLRHFVEVAKDNGLIQAALDNSGVAGKLTVAGPINTKIGGSTVTIYGDQRVPRYYWGDKHEDDGWPK